MNNETVIKISPGARIANGARTLARDIKKRKITYLLILPVVAYYVIFCYIPMYGVIIAFKDFNIRAGIMASPWAANGGFAHFINFFQGPFFTRVVGNTLWISFLDILFSFPAPIIFALLLNELTARKFKKLVQTITYLPYFISIMVVCSLIGMFAGKNGLISDMTSIFTGVKENLLLNPSAFRPIYIASGVWQGVGWGSIIYLAALTNIDPCLYEAAEIDGAGRFRKMLNVTIPGILPTIITMFILRLGAVMSVGYEKILLLQNPLNTNVSDVISTFVYRRGILDADYSFSTAVGLLNSVVNLVVLVSANAFSRKLNDVSLW